MSQLEISYSGYVCAPYLHTYRSVDLKESWINSKNIERSIRSNITQIVLENISNSQMTENEGLLLIQEKVYDIEAADKETVEVMYRVLKKAGQGFAKEAGQIIYGIAGCSMLNMLKESHFLYTGKNIETFLSKKEIDFKFDRLANYIKDILKYSKQDRLSGEDLNQLNIFLDKNIILNYDLL